MSVIFFLLFLGFELSHFCCTCFNRATSVCKFPSVHPSFHPSTFTLGVLWAQLLLQFVLKLCMCFLHGMRMCMRFGYNCYIIFCHFFNIGNLVIFHPQYIDNGYLLWAQLLLQFCTNRFETLYVFIPPPNFVCRGGVRGGYTVFMLSIRPSVRPSMCPSTTLIFPNI